MTAVLRVTVDTNVVVDALNGVRQAALDLFALARAGDLDVAFSTRLEHELQPKNTLEDVQALVARETPPLGTTGRYGSSTYGGGDTYAVPESVSLPTLQRVGKLDAIDSDHLEAHRASGRDVFVTSDVRLLKAARERGIDAATPEELLERVSQRLFPRNRE
jgi:predicted nucleic acid-binding protein